MNRPTKPRGVLNRSAAADLWRNTLSQIPTVFGRLVYLSSLRDANSGAYLHHGLSQVFGATESDQLLRRSHGDAFSEWLSFELEQQKGDLDAYLVDLSDDRRSIVEAWLSLSPYRNLIPVTVSEPERMLYLSDFEALLELLKHEYGAQGPVSD
ncbi:MAG: hypothetical protein NTY38_20895 [Acidobacteria bacterium]|nr:hypothetical protein [Acidobacteriota bacterium]